jgi:uncharacterized membrane protein YpjA
MSIKLFPSQISRLFGYFFYFEQKETTPRVIFVFNSGQELEVRLVTLVAFF